MRAAPTDHKFLTRGICSMSERPACNHSWVQIHRQDFKQTFDDCYGTDCPINCAIYHAM